jgi:hypothetical protein
VSNNSSVLVASVPILAATYYGLHCTKTCNKSTRESVTILKNMIDRIHYDEFLNADKTTLCWALTKYSAFDANKA